MNHEITKILVKGGEWAFIRPGKKILQVGKLRGQRDSASQPSFVVVLDRHIHAGQIFFYGRLDVTKSDGLQPEVRFVKILDWRLQQE